MQAISTTFPDASLRRSPEERSKKEKLQAPLKRKRYSKPKIIQIREESSEDDISLNNRNERLNSVRESTATQLAPSVSKYVHPIDSDLPDFSGEEVVELSR